MTQDDISMTRERGITIGVGHNFHPGDFIQLEDERSRWKRFWDWFLRRPKPILRWTVTSIKSSYLTIRPVKR